MTEEQNTKAQEIKALTAALNAAMNEAHAMKLKVVIRTHEFQHAGDRWTLPNIETHIYKEL